MAFLFPERHLDPALLVPDDQSALGKFAAEIRGSGPFSRAEADAAAARYVTGAGMTFTYLDPHRSTDHQKALRDLSKTVPDAAGKATFWAVPMLLAQRLQTAGDYQTALDWYWIVYPYDVSGPISIYNPINTETPFRPDLTFPPQWTTKLNPFTLVANRPTPFTRYTLMSIIRCS